MYYLLPITYYTGLYTSYGAIKFSRKCKKPTNFVAYDGLHLITIDDTHTHTLTHIHAHMHVNIILFHNWSSIYSAPSTEPTTASPMPET